MRPKPNFMVLGAAKCGTTSLCALLASHPDVLLSEPKEPVFFELEHERGFQYYVDHYFGHWDGQSAVGEGRVFNLFLPYVPRRIHTTLPEARLFVILRDPVERAHSHWWHRVTRGYERRSFEQAIEEELEALARGEKFAPKLSEAAWRDNVYPGAAGLYTADLKSVPYVEMGYFNEQIDRYTALFPQDHIRVLLLADLRQRQEEVIRDLWQFLGVDPDAALPRVGRQNVAKDEVKGSIAFLLERLSWTTGLNRLVPKPVKTAVRSTFTRSAAARPSMPAATRHVLRDHYAARNLGLSQRLQRPLPWSV